MKSLKKLTYLFLLTLVFVSCSDDDIDTLRNEPSSSFDVFISTGENGLQVNWTEAVDPEAEDITYNVYLNDELRDAPQYMTSEFSYLFLWEDINIGTNTIKIIVKDESDGETKSIITYDRIPS